MVANAHKMAPWTLGVYRDRAKQVMLQFYKSLIRSQLEFCSPLWNPSQVRDRNDRRFATMVPGLLAYPVAWPNWTDGLLEGTKKRGRMA